MFIQNEPDSFFLHDDSDASGLFSPRPAPREVDNGLLNLTFVVGGAACNRDKLSVRSLDQLSSFYNSRPASPISERERAVCDQFGFALDAAGPCFRVRNTPTPATERSLYFPKPLLELAPPAPQNACEKYCQTCETDLAGLSVLEEEAPSRRPQKKHRKISKKTGRDARPPADPQAAAPASCGATDPPASGKDSNLQSKVVKLSSFWKRHTKLLPNTFKVSFLCPVRRQAEFLDFSLKEILLEEHHQNGPRPRTASASADFGSVGLPVLNRRPQSAVLQ